MTTPCLKPFAATPLDHRIQPYFPQLAQFSSNRQMRKSALYQNLKPEIDRVLGGIVQEDWSRERSQTRHAIRATAWNVERGIRLQGILDVLSEHEVIRDSEILLITEVDYGMARTENRFIAREIARKLGMHFVFAPCYIALNKGSGQESDSPGENTHALHGNALFSRFPISQAHSLALPLGKDLMRGNEKRLGYQQVIMADVHHPLGDFRAVSLHLDAHSSQLHRRDQMRLVIDHLEGLSPRLPVLIGGDWNTSTYNSRRALYSILGYCRRVLMGIRNVLDNHYPHPERWFERHLFRELDRRGFNYRDLNEMGACTLHYRVDDLKLNRNMGEWVPEWCFWFIEWALKGNGGRCSMKLDWFAGRDLEIIHDPAPRVYPDLCDANGLLSDHDPIVVDFRPVKLP